MAGVYFAAVLVLAVSTGAPAQPVGDERLAASREVAARFQQELGAALTAALAAGGPVEAITVCSVEAPAIAARLSAESGARVGRTALRVRNVANAPSDAQRGVLDELERAVRAGTDQPLERFVTHADGGALYMRGILTQPPCLLCHGADVAAPVKDAIAQHYPEDRATGFTLGDLRGAFSIEWSNETGGR